MSVSAARRLPRRRAISESLSPQHATLSHSEFVASMTLVSSQR